MSSCTTLAIQTDKNNDTNNCTTLVIAIEKNTDVSNSRYVKFRFCEGIIPHPKKDSNNKKLFSYQSMQQFKNIHCIILV